MHLKASNRVTNVKQPAVARWERAARRGERVMFQHTESGLPVIGDRMLCVNTPMTYHL
jgi:hypothetical protein